MSDRLSERLGVRTLRPQIVSLLPPPNKEGALSEKKREDNILPYGECVANGTLSPTRKNNCKALKNGAKGDIMMLLAKAVARRL